MITNLSLSIGFRYIRSKRNNSYISFVSLISFVAMSLGVMVLVVVLSVMNGFEHEIKKRILNVLPHISVTNSSGIINWGPVGEKLLKFDHIEGYAPFVEGYGLLSSSSLSQGVLLQGISPPDEVNASSINDHMIAGEINDLEPGQYGMLIGSMLAGSLGVTVGDKVVLSLPELNVTPVGVFQRYKRFYIRGIYQVGAQVDGGMAFIHYVDAQKLYRLGKSVTGIKLKVEDPFHVMSLIPFIKKSINPSFRIKTWTTEMSSLFNAIKMEKKIVGMLLSVIIAIAAFNIIASLVLMVSSKRRDIAVLRTLGAKESTIAGIFMIQGCIIGILGVIVGATLGCILAVYIGDIVSWIELQTGVHIFDPTVYFISQIPSKLMWADVLLVCCMSLILSILATVYPALRASQVSPAEALRYDR